MRAVICVLGARGADWNAGLPAHTPHRPVAGRQRSEAPTEKAPGQHGSNPTATVDSAVCRTSERKDDNDHPGSILLLISVLATAHHIFTPRQLRLPVCFCDFPYHPAEGKAEATKPARSNACRCRGCFHRGPRPLQNQRLARKTRKMPLPTV